MHTQDAAIMLYRAKEAYQDAGVLSRDIDKHHLHDLYKKRDATEKDLALSGVAGMLNQVYVYVYMRMYAYKKVQMR
jgi:hypothetical protein